MGDFCLSARPMVLIFELMICGDLGGGPQPFQVIFEFAVMLTHRGRWLARVTWSDISCSCHLSRAAPSTDTAWAFCLLRFKHALRTIDAWLFAAGILTKFHKTIIVLWFLLTGPIFPTLFQELYGKRIEVECLLKTMHYCSALMSNNRPPRYA